MDIFLNSLLYGPILWIVLKIIDKILDILIHKVFFTWIYNILKNYYKILKSNTKPINTNFIFSTTFDEKITIDEMKKRINNIFNNHLSEYIKEVSFSNISWWENDTLCKISLFYSDFLFNIQIKNKQGNFDLSNNNNSCINGLTILFNSKYTFGQFTDYIISINALIRVFENLFNESFSIKTTSNGNFEIEPIKREYNIEQWIKRENLDITTTLKSRDNIIITLYPNKSEIVFPYLIIDKKIISSLKNIILFYYL
jgi:hypothetical protein